MEDFLIKNTQKGINHTLFKKIFFLNFLIMRQIINVNSDRKCFRGFYEYSIFVIKGVQEFVRTLIFYYLIFFLKLCETFVAARLGSLFKFLNFLIEPFHTFENFL